MIIKVVANISNNILANIATVVGDDGLNPGPEARAHILDVGLVQVISGLDDVGLEGLQICVLACTCLCLKFCPVGEVQGVQARRPWASG